MKQDFKRLFERITIVLFMSMMLTACGRESSPEGRMSMKLEDLHREMIDSLKQQNRAILDSLSKIREELNEMKQQKR